MNRRRPHVVIFVKAPRIGTVKRRLAAGIGAFAAWRCYREIGGAVLRRLSAEPRWSLWLAVTPDSAARGARHWPPRHRRAVPMLAQGRGDLGARMARILRALPPGPAVIVGSDIPGIEAGLVRAALARLADHDAVFGPAGDGGYWLVGLRRRPAPRSILPGRLFRAVRWSTSHALADTLAGMPKGAHVAFLPRLDDVDEVTGWRAWRQSRR